MLCEKEFSTLRKLSSHVSLRRLSAIFGYSARQWVNLLHGSVGCSTTWILQIPNKVIPLLGIMHHEDTLSRFCRSILLHMWIEKKRCVCETLMPPKHPCFEKHEPDI